MKYDKNMKLPTFACLGIQYFTENELQVLSGENKQVRWTQAEAANAITARLLGPKSYKWWRTERKFPLPGIEIGSRKSTLLNVRWWTFFSLSSCDGHSFLFFIK